MKLFVILVVFYFSVLANCMDSTSNSFVGHNVGIGLQNNLQGGENSLHGVHSQTVPKVEIHIQTSQQASISERIRLNQEALKNVAKSLSEINQERDRLNRALARSSIEQTLLINEHARLSHEQNNLKLESIHSEVHSREQEHIQRETQRQVQSPRTQIRSAEQQIHAAQSQIHAALGQMKNEMEKTLTPQGQTQTQSLIHPLQGQIHASQTGTQIDSNQAAINQQLDRIRLLEQQQQQQRQQLQLQLQQQQQNQQLKQQQQVPSYPNIVLQGMNDLSSLNPQLLDLAQDGKAVLQVLNDTSSKTGH